MWPRHYWSNVFLNLLQHGAQQLLNRSILACLSSPCFNVHPTVDIRDGSRGGVGKGFTPPPPHWANLRPARFFKFSGPKKIYIMSSYPPPPSPRLFSGRLSRCDFVGGTPPPKKKCPLTPPPPPAYSAAGWVIAKFRPDLKMLNPPPPAP